jgi:hypothetical protein
MDMVSAFRVGIYFSSREYLEGNGGAVLYCVRWSVLFFFPPPSSALTVPTCDPNHLRLSSSSRRLPIEVSGLSEKGGKI